MKTVKTHKGTVLPLISLKGKDYLQVAHRLQWFVEENNHYGIVTTFPVLTDEQTVATTVITIMDENGKVLKQVQGTKRESKKDFPDHTEKAETGSLGRALISLGYGTQYALADLDEGDRIVDSPIAPITTKTTSEFTTTSQPKTTSRATFKKPSSNGNGSHGTSTVTNSDGWE